MRVVDRLAEREKDWRELQILLSRMEGKRISRAGASRPQGRPSAESGVAVNATSLSDLMQERNLKGISAADVLRLGELYRSACADLMLAEAHDLPRDTVAFLHALVGRGHNAVYRAKGFHLTDWARVIFDEVPRRLRSDPMLRVAAITFWGLFLLTAFVAAAKPGYAARVVGESEIESMEQMYEHPMDGSDGKVTLERNDAMMAGFYIFHNAGIGLSLYAWGLLFGLGSLWTLASNAITLGLVFGHMATTPQAGNFFTFVTAHGPFELTAIVFAGAAGLRLGSGLIITQGQSRLASLRREGAKSLPIAGVSVILFILAAFLEGFVSASPLPYWSKAAIALISAGILAFYLLALGRTVSSDGGSRLAAI
jgi:uncharacterized membrane protein SpoIIM required for sporulation